MGPLKQVDEIKTFIKENSKCFSSITSIKSTFKGSEAAGFRIEHANPDEPEVKFICLFDESEQKEGIDATYDSVFHESTLLKLNPCNSLVQVREEIIEYNPTAGLGKIISYSVFI